jgi:hypothetical protein
MRKPAISAAAVMLTIASAAQAAPILGPINNPANGHDYYLLAPDSWSSSESQAQGLGGHLVTVNDAAENQFLIDTFCAAPNQGRVLWIGYTDDPAFAPGASEGNFRWASGETPAYTNWQAGEPNNSAEGGGPENYASFNWHFTVPDAFPHVQGTWNDDINGGTPPLSGRVIRHGGQPGPYHGVVEVIPEPATLGLLALAALPLMRRRRA